jgi:hypothetical protein
MVPLTGIEPALLTETDFKSVVYTNFTTEGLMVGRIGFEPMTDEL